MIAKPLIGLSGPSSFTQRCVEMCEEFFEANFVMLYHNDEANLAHWVDQCDGVILAGGADIHPSVYDQSIWNNNNLSKFDLKRDIRELRILGRCESKKKPHLGICRGHQIKGISLGLPLLQDITTSSVCHAPHKQGISLEDWEPMHTVKILNSEQFIKDFGYEGLPEREVITKMMHPKKELHLHVNSYHHQAIAYLGKKNMAEFPITIYGLARIDFQSIKEIVELMGGDNWITCQWHPEADWKFNTASRLVLNRFKHMLSGV